MHVITPCNIPGLPAALEEKRSLGFTQNSKDLKIVLRADLAVPGFGIDLKCTGGSRREMSTASAYKPSTLPAKKGHFVRRIISEGETKTTIKVVVVVIVESTGKAVMRVKQTMVTLTRKYFLFV